MHQKAQNLEEYFNSHGGRQTWLKGRALFERIAERHPIEDGTYLAHLPEFRFSNPKKGVPCVTFPFVLKTGGIIEKDYTIDTPEGMALLLIDLKHLGISVIKVNQFSQVALRIAATQPEALLRIETIKGIQTIKIEAVNLVPAEEFKDAPAPVPEKEPEVPVSAPEVPQPPQEPPVPLEAAPEPPAEEIEILPGDLIRIRVRGGAPQSAKVLKTLEDEGELIVETETEGKILISGSNIIGKLG